MTAAGQIDAKRSGAYRLQLVLDVEGHRASRVLRAERCEELADTAAWLLALALNPELALPEQGTTPPEHELPTTTGAKADRDEPAATEAQGPEEPRTGTQDTAQVTAPDAPKARGAEAPKKPDSTPQPTRSTTRLPAVRTREEPEPTAPRTPRAPWPRAYRAGGAAGVYLGSGVGAQATVAGYAGLGVGFSYTQLRLAGLLPRAREVADDVSIRLWSLELELSECALWGGRVRTGPCVSFAALRTAGDSRGVQQAEHGSAFWGVLGAAWAMFVRVRGRLELSLAATAGVSVTPRPRFTVDGLGPVVTADAWTGQARIGLGFASP